MPACLASGIRYTYALDTLDSDSTSYLLKASDFVSLSNKGAGILKVRTFDPYFS